MSHDFPPESYCTDDRSEGTDARAGDFGDGMGAGVARELNL
jgi:hypothetical protein